MHIANYNYATSVAITNGVDLVSVLEIKRDFVSKLPGLGHEPNDLPGCASKEEKKINKKEVTRL